MTIRKPGMSYRARDLFAVMACIGLVGAVVAAAENTILLESAPGETVTISEGVYTSEGDLSFGALSVTASPVTFDFAATPSRKVVLSSDTAFSVAQRKANVTFKGGEWGGSVEKAVEFLCSIKDVPYTQVFLDNCAWMSLSRVIVGRNAAFCTLTLDNKSKIEAQEFRLVNGGNGNCALNILGGSGLFLSSDNTPFRTDTNSSDGGSGTITVAGEGSILSAPKSEFRIYHAPDHSLIVSNKASLVANKLYVGKSTTAQRARVLVADGASVTAANIYMHSIDGNMTVSNNAEVSARTLDIGRDDSSEAVGANVLIADGSTLTAKEITIRNPGCGMTVSNATLVVDNTANNALKVGYEGRTGGLFVLSGEDAQINYAPSGNVEVFAENGGGAEFRIENGATWNIGANQIAGKTSNSVFRIASGGRFEANGRLQFGPSGDDDADPAHSLSNRLEVCSGGVLEFDGLRFSGNGNALVVSNGTVRCGQIQLGYNRPRWKNDSKVTSRDCALVLRGEKGCVEISGVLQVQNGSVLKFEVPENGYDANITPLKVASLSFDEGTKVEIDCKAFMHKGGKVTLVEASEGIKKNEGSIDDMINAVNASLPEGCSLSLADTNTKLMLTCSKRRFVFSIR